MSINQVQPFINRMKVDESFRQYIMSSEKIEERLIKCVEFGYNFTEEDILAITLIYTQKHTKKNNLPNTWLCQGPCHTQCTDISFESQSS